MGLEGKSILVGVTGSIAAFRAADLVSRLKKEGASVTAILTRSAAKFVGPATFQTLSQRPVVCDLFEDARDWDPEHIAMARDARLLAVVPATANTIAKLAVGIADDALTSTALAVTCPLLLAPAMNDKMWAHPTVRANLETLRQRGATVVAPEEGLLACGTIGQGRLAPVESILDAIRKTAL